MRLERHWTREGDAQHEGSDQEARPRGPALDAIARIMEAAEGLRIHLDGKALTANERAAIVSYDEAVSLLDWRLGGGPTSPG